MNRIRAKFNSNKKLLSIYFTAGYPQLEDTIPVLERLQKSGVDMVEIGMPFSDPLADGPTIQMSSTKALQNGMTTALLFQQLEGVREKIGIPLILMGYFNPVLQFGVEKFCKACSDAGIDGVILPDLPVREYQLHYEKLFKQYGLQFIFLITPQTTEERIQEIDSISEAFIYAVSSSSTTGSTDGFQQDSIDYFKRISNMKLENPVVVGFGIKDKKTFKEATQFTEGAIIGSAFVKSLETSHWDGISPFINAIR